VQLRNVSYSGFLDDDTLSGIGYIKLDRFARGAAAEVRKALQDLEKTGHLRGLVLDLRDNLGGLLDQAVEITQLFVPQGSVIVSTRGRTPETERVYRSKMPPLAPDLPLEVLMNEVSASASEIVGGAIQDLDRGAIVGVPSFGKGLVQLIKPLPYNTSLKITTARYYIPSGRSIQAIDYGRHDGNFSEIPDSLRNTFTTANGRAVMDGHGIEPDVEASLGEPSELEQALQRRAAFFFFANAFAADHPMPNAESCYFGTVRAGCDTGNPFFEAGFQVTDEVYDAFRAWLDTQDFSYRTSAEHAVGRLAGNLDEIGYDDASDEIEALRSEIERQKAADFERHAERLKAQLRTEILSRYLGPTAQIKISLGRDFQVRSAADLLGSAEAYAAVLKP
jgi:carboxyl-terminal processing protease